jgi:hypothetical protein
MQAYGSWTPVFWAAIVCDLLAASLAFFALKPIVAYRLSHQELFHPHHPEVAHARAGR